MKRCVLVFLSAVFLFGAFGTAKAVPVASTAVSISCPFGNGVELKKITQEIWTLLKKENLTNTEKERLLELQKTYATKREAWLKAKKQKPNSMGFYQFCPCRRKLQFCGLSQHPASDSFNCCQRFSRCFHRRFRGGREN